MEKSADGNNAENAKGGPQAAFFFGYQALVSLMADLERETRQALKR